MPVEPKVSVIVPNYNHARFLAKRMDTVLQQSYQDFEIIILDDCSTDDSLDVLAAYRTHPRVSHFVVNEANSGSPFRQWKKGIELARGRYIWIAESDDYADSQLLEQLVPILEKHDDVGIAYANSVQIDENGEEIDVPEAKGAVEDIWHASFLMQGRKAIEELMFDRNAIPNASAVLFRKEVFQSVPLIYLDFRATGDWLVWIEMLKRCNLYFCEKRLNYFRHHSAVTRIHRTKEKRLQVYKERYIILNSLERELGFGDRFSAAYDTLAFKILRLIGFKRALSRTAWQISNQFSKYDEYVRFRMLKAVWQKFLKKTGFNGS